MLVWMSREYLLMGPIFDVCILIFFISLNLQKCLERIFLACCHPLCGLEIPLVSCAFRNYRNNLQNKRSINDDYKEMDW